MAKKRTRPAASAPAAATTARPKRRDLRPYVYGVLDVLFAALYVVILFSTPNRHAWAQAILFGLPLAAVVMAGGTLVGAIVGGKASRPGWIAAVAGGAALLLLTVIVLALLLASAAFLAGVYGSFGRAAASGVLAACALIVELVALLPAFQLKYLLTRAGRRAYGLPPLWKPA